MELLRPNAGERAVIVNADDFGFTPNVTEGIIRAHLDGIVTSTTLMANMDSAEEAVGRLSEAPGLGVGVHLNASQGRPLSREGQVLVDEDGLMSYSATGLIAACCRRPLLVKALLAEFEAQIRWVLDHGIRPTHLDSHRHTHGFPPVFRGVAKLARRYNVPCIRRHRERLPGRGWPASPGRQLQTSRILTVLGVVNRWMAGGMCPTNGTWGVAHTGLIDADWLILVAQRIAPGVTEIMVHPGCRAQEQSGAPQSRLTASREQELAALCDPRVREAFEQNRVKLVHYGQLLMVGC